MPGVEAGERADQGEAGSLHGLRLHQAGEQDVAREARGVQGDDWREELFAAECPPQSNHQQGWRQRKVICELVIDN